MFTGPDPQNPDLGRPTQWYNTLVQNATQRLAPQRRAEVRNGLLQRRNFSEDQLTLGLSLLSPNGDYQLAVIDARRNGAGRPSALALFPGDADAQGHIIWIFNDGHQDEVIETVGGGTMYSLGHWEGFGPGDDPRGQARVRAWGFNIGELDEDSEEDEDGNLIDTAEDDDQNIIDPAAAKNPSGKKVRGKRKRYGKAGLSTRPWDKNLAPGGPARGDDAHYHCNYFGKFIDDGRRKPYEDTRYKYIRRLRQARHNMGIERRPPPPGRTTGALQAEMVWHRRRINPQDSAYDRNYALWWQKAQAERRGRNRWARKHAAEYYKQALKEE